METPNRTKATKMTTMGTHESTKATMGTHKSVTETTAKAMPTELEKIQHLTQKYRDSRRLYTVYSRAGDEGRYVFTLIYGTDNKHKAVTYVQEKEEQGLFLVAYCARPRERSSRCVYVSGMQNTLNGHGDASPSPSPVPAQEG